MQADHGGPLELVRRLVAEPEHDRVAVERLLDAALAEDAAGNAYFAIWSGKPERPSWLSSVELRRSREGSRSLLILAIDGSVCVAPAEVVAEYGEPDGLSRPNPADPASTAPRGEPAMAMTYYTYARAGAGGALAFGFRETGVASCVGRVVFSRDGCLEVRPIPTNTQARSGDVVRIGAGNIWEGTYENATGDSVRGPSAGLSVFVRGRPESTLRLRVGPGSRFEAGGESFEVREVRPDGVTICRHRPRR